MALGPAAQTYLDHFEQWNSEGSTMRDLWETCSPQERDEIRAELRERTHKSHARHAEGILRNLPKQWRDAVIASCKDLP
jgi:hypothetical protein